jgi:hypothetical protein
VCGKGRGDRQTSQHSTGQIASPVPVARRLLLQGWEQHKTLRYDARYAGGANACRYAVCAFLLCPSPFQRLSVAVLIYFIYLYLDSHLSHTRPSPSCRVLRHATHRSKPHHPVPAHSHLQVKWAVESSIIGVVAPATRSPSGPWTIYQSRPRANASPGIAARRVRRTGTTARLAVAKTSSDRPRSRRPVRRLLAFYLRHHHHGQRT